MKRFCYILVAGAIGVSCSGEKASPEQERDTLSLSPSTLTFSAMPASSQAISVVTKGSWTASASDSWIHLSPVSGAGHAAVTVTAEDYAGESPRTGTIAVTGAESRTVTVTQNGSEVRTLMPSPRAFDGAKRAGITYQLLVYSFADSDGDGIGDFNGIASRLDYLDEMGASALWLSPVHPAMSYHGYDVTDYYSVNEAYGTEADFQNLVSKAREKGIDIYLDYVLNHAGRAHPWFLDARQSGESAYRDYFIFSSDPAADIREGRIDMIPPGSAYDAGQWFPTGAGDYYHSHFWTDWFADFNYGKVQEAEHSGAFRDLAASADKWIRMGVAGLRLDAVKHIYWSETSGENPAFLQKWYDRCNATYKSVAGNAGDIYMVGEVFSEAPATVNYYGGLPSCFEFSFWWRLADVLNKGIGNTFATTIVNYHNSYRVQRADALPALKLSNHDENRAAETLGKSLAKEKQAAVFLLTAEGKPFLYQGEELGYWGSTAGGDEYVRTPMLWDRAGTRVARKGVNNKVDNSMLTAGISVEAQQEDAGSLLNVYKTFTQLRNTYPALAEGRMSVYAGIQEASVAAWYMTSGEEKMLVIHNVASSPKTFKVGEDMSKPVALLGTGSTEGASLTLGANSSVVFEL